jgi:hypothetical protein
MGFLSGWILIRLRRTRVNYPPLGAMINIAIDTPLLAAG